MEQELITKEDLSRKIFSIRKQINEISYEQACITAKIEEYKKWVKLYYRKTKTKNGKISKQSGLDNQSLDRSQNELQKRQQEVNERQQILSKNKDELNMLERKYYEQKRFFLSIGLLLVLLIPGVYFFILKQHIEPNLKSFLEGLFIISTTILFSFIKAYLTRKDSFEIYNLAFNSLIKGLIIGSIVIIGDSIVKSLRIPVSENVVLEWQVLISWIAALIV